MSIWNNLPVHVQHSPSVNVLYIAIYLMSVQNQGIPVTVCFVHCNTVYIYCVRMYVNCATNISVCLSCSVSCSVLLLMRTVW